MWAAIRNTSCSFGDVNFFLFFFESRISSVPRLQLVPLNDYQKHLLIEQSLGGTGGVRENEGAGRAGTAGGGLCCHEKTAGGCWAVRPGTGQLNSLSVVLAWEQLSKASHGSWPLATLSSEHLVHVKLLP